MDARLRAVCDLMVPEAREFAGLHDYDGQVQDLSPDGVRRGLPPSVPARHPPDGGAPGGVRTAAPGRPR